MMGFHAAAAAAAADAAARGYQGAAAPAATASNIAIAAFIISIAAGVFGLASLTLSIINTVRISRLYNEKQNNSSSNNSNSKHQQQQIKSSSSRGDSYGKCPNCHKIIKEIQAIIDNQKGDNGIHNNLAQEAAAGGAERKKAKDTKKVKARGLF